MEACLVGTNEENGKKPNKKPDKPLPCPRCASFDTKFCYFNNYNVNQPRHFCRKCRRYWTAGGLLRNVPRGAGRRRSKYNTTHQKHAVLSDAKAFGGNAYDMLPSRSSSKSDAKTGDLPMQKAVFPLDVGHLVSEDGVSASSTILSFGQQRPLCEGMAVHSLSMQQPNMTKGSFNRWCLARAAHTNVASDGQICELEGNDTQASTSSSCLEAASMPATLKHIHRLPEGVGIVPNYTQEKNGKFSTSFRICNKESNDPVKQEERGGLHSTPWHHFDAAKDNSTSLSASHCSNIPWGSFSFMKVSDSLTPPNCKSAKGKAMHMASDGAKTFEGSLSSTTWNGLPGAMWAHPPWPFMLSGPPALDWPNAYWHMPWVLAALAASSNTTRRSGLETVQAGSKAEGHIWVPKTLRIDDPDEAAQSSIWKTLGLDKPPGSAALKEDIKKASECEEGTQDEEKSSTPIQHSNPAALARSLAFNETS